MKWFTSEPPINIPILCKFKTESRLGFYVCTRDSWYESVYKTVVLVEAGGEEYAWWPIDELVAWTTFEELEKNYRKYAPVV